MTESAASAIFPNFASPDQTKPVPPVISGVTIHDKTLDGSVVVVVSDKDENGNPLTAPLVSIGVRFGPAGSDLTTQPWQEYPGSYPPGVLATVVDAVPAWATEYDFQAKVTS
jgi:hypothetical protein